jgi:hypothetical protein
MAASWRIGETVGAGQRLAQAKGQALADLQRRMADRAAGLRRLQESAKVLNEIAKRMTGGPGTCK